MNDDAPAGDSRRVDSNQTDVHPRLEAVVLRHLRAPWRQPPHPPSVAAFEAARELLRADELSRLVLDSGCGTGAGTATLAARHPDAVVIGVDRSAARLARSGAAGPGPRRGEWPGREGNRLLVRAELATFWRLAAAAGWRLQAHYLLYPNPWPKSGQLTRRWHAHPAFPYLLALGGRLVMRCNWEVYAREFATALATATDRPAAARVLEQPEQLTPFERKYAASGHTLFEVTVDLDACADRCSGLLWREL